MTNLLRAFVVVAIWVAIFAAVGMSHGGETFVYCSVPGEKRIAVYRQLIGAYYVAAKATVHRIADDGSLSGTAQQEVATVEKAHAAAIDRSQRFLFVPHTGPNRVYQFRFDAADGRLTPNDPPFLRTPAASARNDCA